MRGAHFSVDLVVDLVGAVIDIESEGESDGTFAFVKFAVEEGEVVLVGLALLELAGEIPMGFGGEGKDDEAGGVHIEPVDRGLINAAGDGVPDAVRNGVDLLGAASRDGEEAAGFFDNDDLFVLKNDGHLAGTLRMASIIC